MRKTDTVGRIREAGVVPVIRAPAADEAIRVAEALSIGGLTVLEIAMTVPDAPEVIDQLRRLLPGATLGAGTVLDVKAARACVGAGARFVVSPALDAAVVAYCRKHDVAVLPGALTPGEVVAAWNAGADLVKVFPAGALGGASYIRTLKAPLPHIELLATGGVTLANARSFIAAGAAAVGVGNDLVDLEAIRRGHASKVSAAARAYVEEVRGARASSASRPA